MRKIGLILLALVLCYFPVAAEGADYSYSGVPGQFKSAKKKASKKSKKKAAQANAVSQDSGKEAAASEKPAPRKLTS